MKRNDDEWDQDAKERQENINKYVNKPPVQDEQPTGARLALAMDMFSRFMMNEQRKLRNRMPMLISSTPYNDNDMLARTYFMQHNGDNAPDYLRHTTKEYSAAASWADPNFDPLHALHEAREAVRKSYEDPRRGIKMMISAVGTVNYSTLAIVLGLDYRDKSATEQNVLKMADAIGNIIEQQRKLSMNEGERKLLIDALHFAAARYGNDLREIYVDYDRASTHQNVADQLEHAHQVAFSLKSADDIEEDKFKAKQQKEQKEFLNKKTGGRRKQWW